MAHEILAERLDCLHLICGLAWLLFGCLGRFGGWRPGHLMTSRWLPRVAWTLAGAQWLRVLNASLQPWLAGDTGRLGQELADCALLITAAFFLGEFLREFWRDSGPAWPGRWIHLGYLVPAAGAGWLAPEAGRLLLCKSLLLLPGAVAAGGLWIRSARRQKNPLVWTLVLVGALTGFLCTTAWLDFQDAVLAFQFLPAAALWSGLGPVVVLVQVALGWLLVLAGCRSDRQEHPPLRGLRWLLAGWLGILIAGGVLAEFAGESRDTELRRNLMSRAQLAAAAMDPAWLQGLTATARDQKHPNYQRLKAQLTKLHGANDDSRFLYLLNVRGTNAVFYADSEPPGSPDISPPGDIYSELSPAVFAAIKQGLPLVAGPLPDRWGVWVSAFVPVRETSSGPLVAALGMDITAADWACRLAQSRLAPLAGTGLLCLLLLTGAIGYQKTALAAAELRRAAAGAEAASRAKDDFLATMSHELRTPMNAVIGMTHLLLDTQLDSRQLECVVAVRRSGESLLQIINDILDFSKIEAGKFSVELEPFDLQTVTEELLELLAPRAQAKQLELAGVLPPEVPRRLRGDTNRLQQILLNLVDNGIKFTAGGEVFLRVSCPAQTATHATLRFAVTDTGIGIAADQQKKLFQPFTQLDASARRRHAGTGLGLAISKRLVEFLGGQIGMTSVPDQGATFWFELPFELTAPAPAAGLELPPAALAGARVLIVSRHTGTREAFAAMLQRWGLVSASVTSLAEAAPQIEAAARAGQPFTCTLVAYELCGASVIQLPRPILLVPASQTTGRIPAGIVAQLATPAKQSQLRDSLVAALTGVAPPRRAAAPPVTAVAAATTGTPPETFRHLRVLVVEDNDINRRLALLMLEKLGCRPDFANDGDAAVDAWDEIPYDVIFMDCQMPVLDGYAATREIRRREVLPNYAARPRTTIVAMTANALRGDREKCLAAGMDDYVSKPVRLGMVEAALNKVVQPAAASAPAAPTDPGDTIAASVAELQREFGAAAAVELLTAFLRDTPLALAELNVLAQSAAREPFARAAHSLAGSCSIFGLQTMRVTALQLEETAVRGDFQPGQPLLAELHRLFTAARPELERRRAAAV